MYCEITRGVPREVNACAKNNKSSVGHHLKTIYAPSFLTDNGQREQHRAFHDKEGEKREQRERGRESMRESERARLREEQL